MAQGATEAVATAADSNTTADLLVKIRGGDRSAENDLIRRHLPELRRWARGRLPANARGAADTEDLVQDTLVQALRHLQAFEPIGPGAFKWYLRVALKNRIRDELRRTSRRPAAGALVDLADAAKPSPFDQACVEETAARYEAALAQLRPIDRALLIAWTEREWTYEKIARALGKPTPDAARMAIRRALQRLWAHMEHLGIEVAAQRRVDSKPAIVASRVARPAPTRHINRDASAPAGSEDVPQASARARAGSGRKAR